MSNKNESWYTQFWPWFLILLPLSVVVAAISTFVIATDNKPNMVVDDYYKKGKAINVDLSLIRRAKELGINASVTQSENNLSIVLNNVSDKSAITLYLHHATLARRDLVQMLTANADGVYIFENKKPLAGKWRIRIEPFDKKWRIEDPIVFPIQGFNVK